MQARSSATISRDLVLVMTALVLRYPSLLNVVG